MANNKFQNKYRIPSARWQNWDYSDEGSYFVTICAKHKIHYFGEIIEKQMYLSKIGEMAEEYWLKIPKYFPFAKLDVFVIMPNHIHGIVVIRHDNEAIRRDAIYRVLNAGNTDSEDANSENTICEEDANSEEDAINRVSTGIDKKIGGVTGNHNPMLYKNLSRVLRWYKGRVSFECRDSITEIWQPRFHDRIIRDHHEYRRVAHYIETNIDNWETDDMYK